MIIYHGRTSKVGGDFEAMFGGVSKKT